MHPPLQAAYGYIYSLIWKHFMIVAALMKCSVRDSSLDTRPSFYIKLTWFTVVLGTYRQNTLLHRSLKQTPAYWLDARLHHPLPSSSCMMWRLSSLKNQGRPVSFFEYLEKIELYCSKENYNLGIFRELENFVLLF